MYQLQHTLVVNRAGTKCGRISTLLGVVVAVLPQRHLTEPPPVLHPMHRHMVPQALRQRILTPTLLMPVEATPAVALERWAVALHTLRLPLPLLLLVDTLLVVAEEVDTLLLVGQLPPRISQEMDTPDMVLALLMPPALPVTLVSASHLVVAPPSHSAGDNSSSSPSSSSPSCSPAILKLSSCV